MRRNFGLFLISLIIIVSFVGLVNTVSAIEEDRVLLPTADTYVDSYEPSLNYGGSTILEVSNIVDFFSSVKIAYLIFDISSINHEIVRINFHIQTSFVDATQEVGLYSIANTSWSEYGLTYNNQPTAQKNFIESQLVAVSFEWYGWSLPLDRFVNDKTCLVLTVAKETDSWVEIWFESKETYFNSDAPRITVYYEIDVISEFPLFIGLIFVVLIPFVRKVKNKLSFR